MYLSLIVLLGPVYTKHQLAIQLSLKLMESLQNGLLSYSGTILFVTYHVRSTREGNVFTGICDSVQGGEGKVRLVQVLPGGCILTRWP